MLHGKKILIGVTAGIAAYKIAFLTRLLVKAGAEVRIIMTPSASSFVTPLTLSTLSGNPVYSDYFDPQTGEWNNHVAFGGWPDVFLIAPATANTLSKMAHGQCDNLLLATYLSAKCPVFFAPAMDLDMYKHPATKENIRKLSEAGDRLIPPGVGELASGLEGEGRMAEPEEILRHLTDHFSTGGVLKGKKVLINAGPTREPIDPVRYIGNRSSGKMGYHLAEEAVARGAEVILVSGPSSLQPPKGAKVERVETADEMYKACMAHTDYDIAILAAAVADYTIKNQASEKIKKSSDALRLELAPTKDILSALGKQKKEGQILVGFALETENEEENALRKLEAKNLDLIVLNSLKDEGAAFEHDTNKVTLIDRHNNQQTIELKQKQLIAKDILDKINEIV